MEWTALITPHTKLALCMERTDGKMAYHKTKTNSFLRNQETLIFALNSAVFTYHCIENYQNLLCRALMG
jgi:hypothetical protein